MNFEGEFIHIGDIPTGEIHLALNADTNTYWQKGLLKESEATSELNAESIPIVWDEQLRHDQPVKQPALDEFGMCLRPVLAFIAKFYETSGKWQQYFSDGVAGYFVRAGFEKLQPNTAIPTKTDEEFSFLNSHRIYIPIFTNDLIFFEIGDTTMNVLEGEVVEINNQKPYTIKNDSNTDCIHLVLDFVVPNETGGN